MDYKEITNRIDELNLDGYKHIKNNDWGIPDELTDWLIERNFKLIGEGGFSDVFQSPTEKFVVKVNNKEEFDRAYVSFVEYCQNNKSNPHLPKMGKLKTFKLRDGEEDSYESLWFVVFIEKLQNYSEDLFGFGEYSENLEDIFNMLIENNCDNATEIRKLFNEEGSEIKPNNKQCENILGCVNTLIDLKNKLKTNLDLHNGNIMQRNGTAVITDPVA